MTETMEEYVVITTPLGLRAIYEPRTDRCWAELPDRFKSILLCANADNVGFIFDDGYFLPGWWIAQEQPDLAVTIERIREIGRSAA